MFILFLNGQFCFFMLWFPQEKNSWFGPTYSTIYITGLRSDAILLNGRDVKFVELDILKKMLKNYFLIGQPR